MRYVDSTDAERVKAAISPATRLIWLETPTNPTLKISDIRHIAQIAKHHQILLCVDNTFASPAAQKPIELGADLVVHSSTKYLGGHSDLIGGLVVCANAELGQQIKFIQNASGAVAGPQDCWLTIRGIETLPIRLKQVSETAAAIANFLQAQPGVRNVYYPGLSTHPNHHIAKQQQTHYGGVVSFDLDQDDQTIASELVSSTRFFKLAESLGGVKSLICLPSLMTHKSVPREKRYQSGLSDSLIRLSVGLEHSEDLIADLSAALRICQPKELFTA